MAEPRSVKISADERGGWSSDRPRREGAPPPRPADVSVRCQVLRPSDRMRYSPGSVLMVASGSKAVRDRFTDRLIEDRASLLSLDKVRGLLAGRVEADDVEARATELLGAAVAKRLDAGETVVVALDGLDADERERYVRMAAPLRRPRHLVLLEVARDDVSEDDRVALNTLRRSIDTGELGGEGFHTALRVNAANADEIKKVLFRPPPRDDD